MGVRTIHTKQHKLLVALIRQEREDRHLDQGAVAKRLGHHPQGWYAHWESGQRRIDVVEYIALAKAIGFDPVKILRRVMAAGPNKPAAASRPARKIGPAGPARIARGRADRGGR